MTGVQTCALPILAAVNAGLGWILSNTGAATSITGSALADTITGGTFDDTLRGSSGNDNITGGLGNDTFVVDNASDSVSEASAEGTDLVQSSITFTLADEDIENLTLTGITAIDGTGNTGNNEKFGIILNEAVAGVG